MKLLLYADVILSALTLQFLAQHSYCTSPVYTLQIGSLAANYEALTAVLLKFEVF